MGNKRDIFSTLVEITANYNEDVIIKCTFKKIVGDDVREGWGEHKKYLRRQRLRGEHRGGQEGCRSLGRLVYFFLFFFIG